MTERDGGRPTLTFHDLGPLVVERDGEPVDLRGRRLTATLSILLVNAGHRVSTDMLVDAVFGDGANDHAESTLESHLWRLRRLLEPDRARGEPATSIVHDHGGYRLVAVPDQVDSLRLGTLVGQVRDLLLSDQGERALSRVEDALSLWRGEPWTPHTDAEWAVAPASRLREIVSQLHELRIQALLATGDAATALTDVDPLLDANTLRERLWAMSMVAAYRLGRVQQALDTYTRARTVLRDEAGIEPGAELRALQSRILERDSNLDPQPAGSSVRLNEPEVHLPEIRGPLYGREADVDTLMDLVSAERLVSIVGAAGCGKTTLAVEVGHRTGSRFPDGLWFVDLTSARSSDELLGLITADLGIAAADGRDRRDALRTFGLPRRMLIVLDNCEHLLDEVADLIETCFRDCPELTVLVTSREPLDLDAERIHDLAPLALPQDGVDVAALRASPAVALLSSDSRPRPRGVRSGRRISRLSLRSAPALTGCRWPSSSRPVKAAASPWPRSPSGSTTIPGDSPGSDGGVRAGTTRPCTPPST